jgi:hypothetical protein
MVVIFENNEKRTKKANMESTYRIKIQGLIGSSFADWFGKITVIPQENNETLLIGQFADQAALRGMLDQLWNLNFTVLSMERIGNERSE